MQPRKKDLLDYLFPLLGVVIVLFLSLHMAAAYELVKDTPRFDKATGRNVFNVPVFFDVLFNQIEDKPFGIRYVASTFRFIGYGAGICFFTWAYVTTTRKKLIPGKEFGTADWGKPSSAAYLTAARQVKAAIREIKKKKRMPGKVKKKKIEAVKKKYKDSDMLLTKTEKICIYNRELNNNTLIIGGSGSGKTRSYVLPNILQAHSSYVITDPKGEIFHKAAFFLDRIQNYRIRVLNLDVMSMSDGYNPFHYIHMEREGWEERVLTLIETIIINTDGGEKRHSNDPFWEKAERLFLQALFFAVLQDNEPEDQTMNTVLKLMGDLQLEDDNDNKNSRLDLYFNEFAARYTPDHIAVQQFREFRDKASGRTAKSIVISASARLSPFRISGVRRIFSYDNMSLDRVGEEKTAIFVVVPPTNKTFSFIAGMLFTQLFQELNHCALNVHKRDGQVLPVPCRFILDEFANTCVIPNFVQILAYARSLGVGITTILQSLEQIKKMYKDEWGVIVDNCNTLLYLGSVSHVETLEYLSKSLGKATFDKKDYSRSRGRHGSSTTANNRVGRELLMPDEIRNLRKSACLLLVGGKSPFYSQKIDLRLHKNYKYTSEVDGEKHVIEYSPEPPPEKPEEIWPIESIFDAVAAGPDSNAGAARAVLNAGAAGADSNAGVAGVDSNAGAAGAALNARAAGRVLNGGAARVPSALDGMDEEFEKGKVDVDITPSAVLGVINLLRHSGAASFDGIGMDETEEQTINALIDINGKFNEEDRINDSIMDSFVEVSTDLNEVSRVMGGFVEGEAHGVPTTFEDPTYIEPGEAEPGVDEVLDSFSDYEDTDYGTVEDNTTTESFRIALNNVIMTDLAEGERINSEKEYDNERATEVFEAAL